MLSNVEAGKRAEGTFLPINLTSLRTDSMTHFDIYIEPGPGQPYVLYSDRNIPFTETARDRLVDGKIDRVFIHSSQILEYSRYIENNLAGILADTGIATEEKTEMLYSSGSGVVESLLSEPRSRDNLQRSKDVVKNAVNFMLRETGVFRTLLATLSSTYQVYSHSMNVVTYAVALAQRTGHNDAAMLRELAIGALLHDVGKHRIPASVVECTGTLTPAQWELMQCHPQFGYDLLAESQMFSEIALDIVLHHHEKLRGGGYPDNLHGSDISPFVRIVTIADIFDALTTDRPFRKARKSFPALSVMRGQAVADLDPSLFKTFITMMGNPDA